MRNHLALQRILVATALIVAAVLLSGPAQAEQRYSGVWESGGGGYYLWVGVDWASFENKWKDLARQNLRLVDFETYVEGGRRKYAGVWRSGSDGHYLWVGVDWKSFENKRRSSPAKGSG